MSFPGQYGNHNPYGHQRPYGGSGQKPHITLDDLNATSYSDASGAYGQGGGGNVFGGLAASGSYGAPRQHQPYPQHGGPQYGHGYPQGHHMPNPFASGIIDGMPLSSVVAGIGMGGPWPGDPFYDYGFSRSVTPMPFNSNPFGGGFPQQGPFGPGPYGPQGVDRTLFRPGNPANHLAAAAIGGGVSLLQGGGGVWGAVGAAGGSFLGKTDTQQALYGGLIGGATSFFMNKGMDLFNPLDSYNGHDDEDNQYLKRTANQKILANILPDAIGGVMGLFGGGNNGGLFG